MPLYEYKCLKCGRATEKIEPVNGPHLRKCPHCRGRVEAVISAPAIQFKGTGWYVTDYAAKSGDGGGREGKGTGDSKEGSSAGGGANDSGGKEAGNEAGNKEGSGKPTGSKDTSAKDKKPAKKK